MLAGNILELLLTCSSTLIRVGTELFRPIVGIDTNCAPLIADLLYARRRPLNLLKDYFETWVKYSPG